MRVDRFNHITIQYFSAVMGYKTPPIFNPLFNRLFYFSTFDNLAKPCIAKIALAME
jgi:hypothetical protein